MLFNYVLAFDKLSILTVKEKVMVQTDRKLFIKLLFVCSL